MTPAPALIIILSGQNKMHYQVKIRYNYYRQETDKAQKWLS